MVHSRLVFLSKSFTGIVEANHVLNYSTISLCCGCNMDITNLNEFMRAVSFGVDERVVLLASTIPVVMLNHGLVVACKNGNLNTVKILLSRGYSNLSF